MIGVQRDHHRRRIHAPDLERRPRQRRGRAARGRLRHQAVSAQAGQTRQQRAAECLVGDDAQPRRGHERQDPVDGVADEGLVGGEGQ